MPPQPQTLDPQPPSLPRQAWNLARAVAAFVADGCRTVDAESYRRRLETCDPCTRRRANRCLACGCRLTLKARGRAFRCPLDKWPQDHLPSPLGDDGPKKHLPSPLGERGRG